MYVLAYFADTDGSPKTGLTPTISSKRIPTLVADLLSVSMTEAGLGWYFYNFTTFNPALLYIFTIDGGATLVGIRRYAVGTNAGGSVSEDIIALQSDLTDLSTDYANQYYAMRDLNRKMLRDKERKANEQG